MSTAKANEKVFNLAREKASMEVSLQQQLDQVKEELDQVKDTNKTVQEDSACELKAQNSATIDELVKEHAATVAGLEEQMVTITAELKESRLQLQQTTIMMVEKDSKVSELMDKVSHSEQQLLNVRKILHEAPTLVSYGMSECVCVRVRVCVYRCMYIRMYVCMYACMYVYTYVCANPIITIDESGRHKDWSYHK